MRKMFVVLCFLVAGDMLAKSGYVPVSQGKWPFIRPGYSFSPSVKADWSFATRDALQGYSIYFYYTGNENPKSSVEAGGIQMISGAEKYFTTEQLKMSIRKFDDVNAGTEYSLIKDDMVADPRFGPLCLRFSRQYRSTLEGKNEGISDEGCYFVHPNNNREIFKVHLFYKGPGGDTITSMASEMEQFYKLFFTTSDFSPKWSLGAGWSIDVGLGDGLDFGFVDARTNEPILLDPGIANLFAVEVNRKLRSPFYAGFRAGYTGYTDALLLSYSNLKAYSARGFYAEVNGGVLLFSRFRHQVFSLQGLSSIRLPRSGSR